MQTGLSQMHLALYRVHPQFYSEVKGEKRAPTSSGPEYTVLLAVFITVTKGTTNFGEEGFILADGMKKCSPPRQGKKYQKEAHSHGCGNLVNRRKRRGNTSAQLASPSPHFNSVQDHSSADGTSHVKGGFSSSVKALWTHPQK